MRGYILGSATVFLVCCASGCLGDPRTDVLKQQLSAHNEMADTLAQVTDEKTAKAWKPALKRVNVRIKDVKDLAKKLEKPTEEQYDDLKKAFDEDIKYADQRLNAELARVRNNQQIWAIVTEVVTPSEFGVVIPAPQGQRIQGPGGMKGGMPGGGMGGGMAPPNGGGPNGPNGGPMGPPMGPPK